jgi:hypothetical protein
MNDSHDRLLGFAALAAALAPASIAVAAEYLSVEAAQKAVFPEAAQFQEIALDLTPERRQSVLALAGMQPRRGTLRVWEARDGERVIGHFFVDEVAGRQEFITYALGIEPGGALRAPQIMAYRESHGGEVRNKGWRKQFADAHGLDELRFRADIRNIAGATLSCEHVTQGVRYLVALWQTSLATNAGPST